MMDIELPWLRQAVPDALVVDLLQPDAARELTARPERLNDIVRGAPERQTVVLDEVQRVPELLNVVHALIESKERRRFVLTGSSARKFRRGGVDLLAGRAGRSNAASVHGGRAGSLRLRARADPWARAAREGIRATGGCPPCVCVVVSRPGRAPGGLDANIGAFARFLEAISFSHGSVLNLANVARECEVERKTVATYTEVLEDLLLAFRVPVFTRKAKRETSAHPKLFLFDAGVFRSLRPKGPLDRPEEIDGAALEGVVAQHLRAWLAYRGVDADLYLWRTRSGVEVDFVVYGAAGFWGIEVKNRDRIRPEDLRGLEAFATDYPQAEVMLLYRGTRRERRGRVWILPVDEFLRDLHPSNASLLPNGRRRTGGTDLASKLAEAQ